jgi:hypothetical protein
MKCRKYQNPDHDPKKEPMSVESVTDSMRDLDTEDKKDPDRAGVERHDTKEKKNFCQTHGLPLECSECNMEKKESDKGCSGSGKEPTSYWTKTKTITITYKEGRCKVCTGKVFVNPETEKPLPHGTDGKECSGTQKELLKMWCEDHTILWCEMLATRSTPLSGVIVTPSIQE